MSVDSSSTTKPYKVPWTPLAGAVMVLFFLASTYVAGAIIITLAHLVNRNSVQVDSWIMNSSIANLTYGILAACITLVGLYWFVSYRKVTLRQAIGLDKPKWRYAGYAVAGWVLYILSFIVIMTICRVVLPIDVNQEQALGFQKGVSGAQLVMAFIGLVIVPPLVEESVFRGFLFGSFRSNKWPFWLAAAVTSVVFGSLHLFNSSNGGLLWVAFIDTSLLSLILCYAREKTQSIWTSIGIHALKNCFVFVNLFLLGN